MQRISFLFTPVFVAALMIVGIVGCEKRSEPTPAQPVAEFADKQERPMTRQFDRSCQNADLANMAVSDMHFMPNRAVLNGAGTAKLNRLAWIVDHYGGAIMIDLAELDTPLTRARIDTVVAYLQNVGLARDKIQTMVGLPSTSGMAADEAVTVYDDTRYNPKRDGKGSICGSDQSSGMP